MEYDTIFAAARRAGNELALVDAGRLSRTVVKAAALLRENAGKVLAANALDLEAMDADSPMRDRLRLTAERIASIAADMESVAGLPSPQGETIGRKDIRSIEIIHHWSYDELLIKRTDGRECLVPSENAKLKVNDGKGVREYSVCKLTCIYVGGE